MQNKIELTKSVPQERWGEFFDQFVDAPTEIFTGQSESGRMLAVWINDAAGTKTLVKLQPVES